MSVHGLMGADACFGSHADGRAQKASASCFPILANIFGSTVMSVKPILQHLQA